MVVMWIGAVTLFPEMFAAVSEYGITGRAVRDGLLELACWNPRDFAVDRHRTVDDKPYGGGPGMVMMAGPLRAAIGEAKNAAKDAVKDAVETAATGAGQDADHTDVPVICLGPQGEPLTQALLTELAALPALVLVAGRYEGIDERVMKQDVTREISIGDYVVSGGELPAMVLIDGMTRLLPGAVGDPDSVIDDSFTDGLLDFPHYTRPADIGGEAVPGVLQSGDHAAIARWRRKQALGRTWQRRPDLASRRELSEDEQVLLDEYRNEHLAATRDEQDEQGQGPQVEPGVHR